MEIIWRFTKKILKEVLRALLSKLRIHASPKGFAGHDGKYGTYGSYVSIRLYRISFQKSNVCFNLMLDVQQLKRIFHSLSFVLGPEGSYEKEYNNNNFVNLCRSFFCR